jgi:hypothetical protein
MSKNKKIPEKIKHKVLNLLLQKTERNLQRQVDDEAIASLEKQISNINDGN